MTIKTERELGNHSPAIYFSIFDSLDALVDVFFFHILEREKFRFFKREI